MNDNVLQESVMKTFTFDEILILYVGAVETSTHMNLKFQITGLYPSA